MIPRYTRPEMEKIWSDENKFNIWLQIEILAVEAHSKLGLVPESAVEEIKNKARFDVKRILEIEAKVKHDVVAFLTSVSESVGDVSKYIHYGMTSSDVLDTCLAVQMKQAGEIILDDLEKLSQVLREKAIKHKYTIMIGRTHGVHAEPITLGFKFALWFEETKRNIDRMKRAVENISYGKIAGAVGTYDNVNPFVEKYVCEKLGLKVEPVSTQIIQRDRHAEYLTTLAIIASSLEKFATEIRHLQRTEVLEAEEYFSEGQKGSSAMPHKRNPVRCERISGLARVVRANALASLENITLWHERDISHSSVERIIIPDSTTIVDFMLNEMIDIIDKLLIYPDRMLKNLSLTNGLIFSQKVLLALIEKGLTREKAYELVQRNAMKCWKTGERFAELLKRDPDVSMYMSDMEIEKIFDYGSVLEKIDFIFERIGIEKQS
ncbi:adenylosuccinate lyase [Candidatus Kryptobacter tengchongensis]|nr:adenylosuccinate lyase [Candidatus Kryptobacter tengchongensis]CUU10900.1 adenylosuccinate lyase [Candidatus Kryptobacter tengchongensis]